MAIKGKMCFIFWLLCLYRLYQLSGTQFLLCPNCESFLSLVICNRNWSSCLTCLMQWTPVYVRVSFRACVSCRYPQPQVRWSRGRKAFRNTFRKRQRTRLFCKGDTMFILCGIDQQILLCMEELAGGWCKKWNVEVTGISIVKFKLGCLTFIHVETFQWA